MPFGRVAWAPPADGAPRDTEMPRRRAMHRVPSVDGIARGHAMVSRVPAGTLKRSTRLLGYWLVTFGSVGMQYAFGPIFVLLLSALGDNREVTALVGSLSVGIEDGLGGIFSAWAIIRFGPRRCIIMGSAFSALGWGLSSLVNESWQLLLTYSVLIGIGHSLALYSAVMTTNQWFSKRLALAHAVGSTGGAVSPFLSGLLTPSLANAVGWRNALRVYAGVNCGVLLLAALLLSPPPPPEEEEEEDIKVIKAEAILADAVIAPNPLKAAPERDAQFPELMQLLRRNRVLQSTMLASFFFGLGCWIAVVHMVRMAMDNGMSVSEASGLTMYLALGGLAMRVPAGVLADVFGRLKICVLANICLCLIHLVVAIPGAATSKLTLTLFAVGVGGFNGATFTVLPAIPSELKLPKRFSNIMSVAIFSPCGLGCLAGPPIAGVMHTAFGNYRPAMMLASTCFATGCALLTLTAFLLRSVPAVAVGGTGLGGNGLANKIPRGSTPLTLPTGVEVVLIVDGGHGAPKKKRMEMRALSYYWGYLRGRPGGDVHKHLPLPQQEMAAVRVPVVDMQV